MNESERGGRGNLGINILLKVTENIKRKIFLFLSAKGVSNIPSAYGHVALMYCMKYN